MNYSILTPQNAQDMAKQTFSVRFVADFGRNVSLFCLIAMFLHGLCFLIRVILPVMLSIPLSILVLIPFSFPLFIFVLLGLLGLFAAIAITAGCRRRGRRNTGAAAGGSGGGNGGCGDGTGGEGQGGRGGKWLVGWAGRVGAAL